MRKLIALIIGAFPIAACALNVSHQIDPGPDGVMRTSDKGGTGGQSTLDWNNTCLQAFVYTGLVESADSFDEDVRACLTGTESTTATITITDETGDDATDNGWAITQCVMETPSDCLSNDGTDADLPGTGAFTLNAADTATAVSDVISWQFISLTSDTTAPTIPTWDSPPTVSDTDEITFQWLASADIGDGVQDYQIYEDSGDTVIATVTSGVQSGIQLSYTSTEIGTVGGTPAYAITGFDHDITCIGSGINTGGGDDSLCVQYAPITGDFDCRMTVDAFDPGDADFAQGGIMFRESQPGTNPDARMVAALAQADAAGTNIRIHGRSRSTEGGGTGSAFVNVILSLRQIRLVRSGSTWTIYHKQTSDAEWTNAGPVTNALPASGYIMSFASANDGTMDAALQTSQFHCTQSPALTHAYSTMETGESYYIKARDNETTPNESAASVTVAANPGAPPSGSGLKSNFGPYVRLTDPFSQILNEGQITEVCNTTNAEGILIPKFWRDLETSLNTYDFAQVQQALDLISGCGKRLMLRVKSQEARCTNAVPDYLLSGTYQGGATMGGADGARARCKPMYWKSVVMDRYIALSDALAAQFGDQANFEAIIIMSEPALGQHPVNTVCWVHFADGSCGSETQYTIDYVPAAFVTQLQRLATEQDAWFDTGTPSAMYINTVAQASQSQIASLISHMSDVGMVHGWPDTFPQGIAAVGMNPGTIETRSAGQKIRIGEVQGTDYRGTMQCISGIQPPEMGGKDGNHLPSDLFAEANTTLECGYHVWTRKMHEINSPDYGADEARWLEGGAQEPDGIKAAMIAGSLNPSGDALNCPTNYTQHGGC